MNTHMSPQPERVIVLAVAACEVHSDTPNTVQARAERVWREVFAAVQQVIPEVAELRPGLCAMRARGPARYYGDETKAAHALLECIAELDAHTVTDAHVQPLIPTSTVGIAQGRFAAQLAAHAHPAAPGVHAPIPGVHIIAPSSTTDFLSPLPVTHAVSPDLAHTLTSLGVHTLGDFARLPEQAILQRFGRAASAAHRRARGLGEAHAVEVAPNTPPRELSVHIDFEPPLDGADQLAFACAAAAERFVQGLASDGLVCTDVSLTLRDDTGTAHERQWSHPANFTAADVVNRVRWQASSLVSSPERSGAGICSARFTPLRTASAAEHEPGLWNDAPDERIHHQLTRVQSLLGPESLGTGRLRGGRLSTDRQLLLPWAHTPPTPHSAAHGPDGPWPGHLDEVTPNIVFQVPPSVTLVTANDHPVSIDADDLLSEDPARFGTGPEHLLAVHAWSAPWPLREHWWAAHAETVYRLQLVLEGGDAWLLRFSFTQGWLAEGRYA
jgi:protein ImuB